VQRLADIADLLNTASRRTAEPRCRFQLQFIITNNNYVIPEFGFGN
jgi:hypothetical protein